MYSLWTPSAIKRPSGYLTMMIGYLRSVWLALSINSGWLGSSDPDSCGDGSRLCRSLDIGISFIFLFSVA